ncbi:MAG: hypothetical protein ACXACG_18410, partial [Candidatus Thorarchaeota archaeon]
MTHLTIQRSVIEGGRFLRREQLADKKGASYPQRIHSDIRNWICGRITQVPVSVPDSKSWR